MIWIIKTVQIQSSIIHHHKIGLRTRQKAVQGSSPPPRPENAFQSRFKCLENSLVDRIYIISNLFSVVPTWTSGSFKTQFLSFGFCTAPLRIQADQEIGETVHLMRPSPFASFLSAFQVAVKKIFQNRILQSYEPNLQHHNPSESKIGLKSRFEP